MKYLNERKENMKEIEKLVKPNTATLATGTLILLGPYGNLILKIIEKGYKDLLLTSLIVFPTLILMSFYWCWYVYSLRTYKKAARDIFIQQNKE